MLTKVWEWSNSQNLDRLVLLALADYADDEGFCFPGMNRIAKKSRVSERTAQRCIKSLIQLKELEVSIQCGMLTEKGKTNRYRIMVKPGCQAVTPEGEGVTNQAGRGDKTGREGVTRLSSYPSVEPSVEPSGRLKRFSPPTLEEVKKYAEEIKLPSEEAEAFFDHQETIGWLVGKTGRPMKSWQGALRTWQRNGIKYARERIAAAPPGAGKPAREPYWQQICREIAKDMKDGKIGEEDKEWLRDHLQSAVAQSSPEQVKLFLIEKFGINMQQAVFRASLK